MSNLDYQRKQAQEAAKRNQSQPPPSSFNSDAERKAYQAEYNRNKK